MFNPRQYGIARTSSTTPVLHPEDLQPNEAAKMQRRLAMPPRIAPTAPVRTRAPRPQLRHSRGSKPNVPDRPHPCSRYSPYDRSNSSNNEGNRHPQLRTSPTGIPSLPPKPVIGKPDFPQRPSLPKRPPHIPRPPVTPPRPDLHNPPLPKRRKLNDGDTPASSQSLINEFPVKSRDLPLPLSSPVHAIVEPASSSTTPTSPVHIKQEELEASTSLTSPPTSPVAKIKTNGKPPPKRHTICESPSAALQKEAIDIPFPVKQEPIDHIPQRRLVRESCTFYPIPDNCCKSHPNYQENRITFFRNEYKNLRQYGLTKKRVVFRDDGMAIEWTSPIPVWSDTFLPEVANLASAISMAHDANRKETSHRRRRRRRSKGTHGSGTTISSSSLSSLSSLSPPSKSSFPESSFSSFSSNAHVSYNLHPPLDKKDEQEVLDLLINDNIPICYMDSD